MVDLLRAGTECYTAVQTLIPVATFSEVLFTRAYDLLARRPGDAAAATLLLGYDSLPIRAEKSLFDLARWVCSQPQLKGAVLASTSSGLLADRASAEPRWPALWSRLQDHLDTYGHLVYNLDFVNPVPADDPGPLLDTLRASTWARSPRTRTGASCAAPWSGRRRPPSWFPVSVARAAPSSCPCCAGRRPQHRCARTRWPTSGLAWHQLRRVLTELGRQLVAAGVVAGVDDVYWLRADELSAALAQDRPASLAAEVEQRRRLWRGQRRSPRRRCCPRGLVAADGAVATRRLHGPDRRRAHGPGGQRRAGHGSRPRPHRTGGLRLVPGGRGAGGADHDPAWASLFVRAAAVVTDVGGPLSHSSIVAREYGIPAVLGTGVATRRIRTGQRITVDGDAGTVTLLEDPGELDGAEWNGQGAT